MKNSLLGGMTMAFKICIITSCFLNVERTFAQGTGLTKCYADKDNDGFGDPNDWVLVQAGFGCPPFDTHPGTSNGFDCDDNNAQINPNTFWYKDADNDLLAVKGAVLQQCERPAGYKLASEFPENSYRSCSNGTGYGVLKNVHTLQDCDDVIFNPDSTWFVWYVDHDNDGFPSDLNQYVISCGAPSDGINYIGFTYKQVGRDFGFCNALQDCNDNDPLSTINQDWYLDGDGDGFPLNNTPEFNQCQYPPGGFYKTKSQLKSLAEDCKDNDAEIFPGSWYEDKDGDGLTTGNSIYACIKPEGYTFIPEGAILIDCDDNDPEATISQAWYPDADGDRHGNNAGFTAACNRPTGYFTSLELLSTNDCNDNNGAVHPGAIEYCNGIDDDCDGQIDEGFNPSQWVLDKDNDNYYAGNPVTACEVPGEGYVVKSDELPGDCNDNDETINPTTTWYIDKDNDGYYNTSVIYAPSCTPPGPSFNTTTTKGPDCNDNDAAINPETIWYIDKDNDGYYNTSVIYAPSCTSPGPSFNTNTTKGPDCNDNDASINPETIWLLDADGDGYHESFFIAQHPSCTPPQDGRNYINNSKGQDCDDNDASYNPETVWVKDADADGYYIGEPYTGCFLLFQPGYVRKTNQQPGDCDDTHTSVHPDATEICDGLDNNCNSQTDEGVKTTFYLDADTDGYGNPNSPTQACSAPAGYVSNNTDCDDTRTSVHPDATEICDGLDNNCNGQTDEGVKSTFYRDADTDGYGNPLVTTQACSAPQGYVSNNTDCDDTRTSVHPGATEICDGLDNNCNGLTDEGVKSTFYRDADSDGFGNPSLTTQACSAPQGYVANNTDCNDNANAIHPGATEVCDGIDNDCDGIVDVGVKLTFYKDTDADGYGNAAISIQACSAPAGYVSSNTDCNDNDPTVNPGSVEVCGNRIDDNCNGVVDESVCYICLNATNLKATSITSTSAQISWNATANAVQWQLQYKTTNKGSKWVDVLLTGNLRTYKLTSLSSNQNYQVQIRAKCGNTWTIYSAAVGFKTTSTSLSRQASADENTDGAIEILKLHPNPTNGKFMLELKIGDRSNSKAQIQLVDMLGRAVYSQDTKMHNGFLQKTISVSSALAHGTYLVKVVVNDKIYKTQVVYQK